MAPTEGTGRKPRVAFSDDPNLPQLRPSTTAATFSGRRGGDDGDNVDCEPRKNVSAAGPRSGNDNAPYHAVSGKTPPIVPKLPLGLSLRTSTAGEGAGGVGRNAGGGGRSYRRPLSQSTSEERSQRRAAKAAADALANPEPSEEEVRLFDKDLDIPTALGSIRRTLPTPPASMTARSSVSASGPESDPWLHMQPNTARPSTTFARSKREMENMGIEFPEGKLWKPRRRKRRGKRGGGGSGGGSGGGGKSDAPHTAPAGGGSKVETLLWSLGIPTTRPSTDIPTTRPSTDAGIIAVGAAPRPTTAANANVNDIQGGSLFSGRPTTAVIPEGTSLEDGGLADNNNASTMPTSTLTAVGPPLPPGNATDRSGVNVGGGGGDNGDNNANIAHGDNDFVRRVHTRGGQRTTTSGSSRASTSHGGVGSRRKLRTAPTTLRQGPPISLIDGKPLPHTIARHADGARKRNNRGDNNNNNNNGGDGGVAMSSLTGLTGTRPYKTTRARSPTFTTARIPKPRPPPDPGVIDESARTARLVHDLEFDRAARVRADLQDKLYGVRARLKGVQVNMSDDRVILDLQTPAILDNETLYAPSRTHGQDQDELECCHHGHHDDKPPTAQGSSDASDDDDSNAVGGGGKKGVVGNVKRRGTGKGKGKGAAVTGVGDKLSTTVTVEEIVERLVKPNPGQQAELRHLLGDREDRLLWLKTTARAMTKVDNEPRVGATGNVGADARLLTSGDDGGDDVGVANKAWTRRNALNSGTGLDGGLDTGLMTVGSSKGRLAKGNNGDNGQTHSDGVDENGSEGGDGSGSGSQNGREGSGGVQRSADDPHSNVMLYSPRDLASDVRREKLLEKVEDAIGLVHEFNRVIGPVVNSGKYPIGHGYTECAKSAHSSVKSSATTLDDFLPKSRHLAALDQIDFQVRNKTNIDYKKPTAVAARSLRRAVNAMELGERAITRRVRGEVMATKETIDLIAAKSTRREKDRDTRIAVELQPMMEMQARWLEIANAGLFALRMHAVLTASRSRKEALEASPVLAMLREKNKQKRERTLQRAHEMILEWIRVVLPAAQTRIRTRAALCLRDFMTNHRVSTEEPYKSKVINAIRTFKRNVMRCQRFVRGFLAATHERLAQLGRVWAKVEKLESTYWFGLQATTIALTEGPGVPGAAPMCKPHHRRALLRRMLKQIRIDFNNGDTMREFERLTQAHRNNKEKRKMFRDNILSFLSSSGGAARLPDELRDTMMQSMFAPLRPQLALKTPHDVMKSLVREGWELSGVELPEVPFEVIKHKILMERGRGGSKGNLNPSASSGKSGGGERDKPRNETASNSNFRSSQFDGKATRLKT